MGSVNSRIEWSGCACVFVCTLEKRKLLKNTIFFVEMVLGVGRWTAGIAMRELTVDINVYFEKNAKLL